MLLSLTSKNAIKYLIALYQVFLGYKTKKTLLRPLKVMEVITFIGQNNKNKFYGLYSQYIRYIH